MRKVDPQIFLVAAIALVYFLYAPGLSGGFMLDDEVNLIKLNLFHTTNGIDSIINYILANESGFLKRPISSLSFLLNATNWPANPYYFKITNILLHMVNGALLYFLSILILKLINNELKNIRIIALLASIIWLVHPFFVSTVLYIVQRHSILSTMFTLIGMLLYCHGRLISRNSHKEGLIYIYTSIFLFTTLATLSKENGILLPFLLLIFEFVIVKKSDMLELAKIHKVVLFYIPIFIIVVALLYKFPSWCDYYDNRNFSLSERLLTQPRVLTNYLYHLFVPEYLTEGVYTDGFRKSVGLFQPITTFFSIIFIFLLIIISVLLRKSQPLFSFALLFFFSAHLLESTFIPLELYYEHRNYLPALFLPLFVSYYLIHLSRKNNFLYVLPLLMIFYLSMVTVKTSTLWGNDFALATKTAEKFPESVRASTTAAGFFEKNNQRDLALSVLKRSKELNDSVSLQANYLSLKCNITKLEDSDFNELKRRIVEEKFISGDRDVFINFITHLIRTNCSENKFERALLLLNAIKNSKDYNGYRVKETVGYGLALTYVHMKDFDRAFLELKDLVKDTKNHLQAEKIFYILKYFLGHKKFDLAKRILKQMQPKLNSSGFEPDIYNQRAQWKYYYAIASKK